MEPNRIIHPLHKLSDFPHVMQENPLVRAMGVIAIIFPAVKVGDPMMSQISQQLDST